MICVIVNPYLESLTKIGEFLCRNFPCQFNSFRVSVGNPDQIHADQCKRPSTLPVSHWDDHWSESWVDENRIVWSDWLISAIPHCKPQLQKVQVIHLPSDSSSSCYGQAIDEVFFSIQEILKVDLRILSSHISMFPVFRLVIVV